MVSKLFQFQNKKKVLTEVPITYLVLHSQTVGFDLVSLELSHVEVGLPAE